MTEADFPGENQDSDEDLLRFMSSWPDSELLRFLAEAWDQEPGKRIDVVGKVLQHQDSTFGWLDDLHHPETGLKLAVPLDTPLARHHRVFVPPADMGKFLQRARIGDYARAAINLSPKKIREERQYPLATAVRPGTLTPLSKVPEHWGLHSISSESGPLIANLARETIEARLKLETAEAEEELSNAKEKLGAARSEQAALRHELKESRRELEEHASRISELETEAEQRRMVLESKLEELESLLREKGDRMVALRLINEADLERLIPSKKDPQERIGHDFGDALGADFEKLAAYVQAHLWRKGMHYSRAQLMDFITLLRTNDLIVLAGDSGSGKTSLVKSMADALGGRCHIVPVKPNWTSSEDLLGYYNPIERRYHPSPFLHALLAASNDPDVPHFICLDEMNLARVEYYFADFLSLLESRGDGVQVPLYANMEEAHAAVDNRLFLTLEQEARARSGLAEDATLEDILRDDVANKELRKLGGFEDGETILAHHAKLRGSLAGLLQIPPTLPYPRNVWIIGAINVDETTHYLSPKILDRAHVMRFRNPVLVDWDSMERELEEFEIDMDLPVAMKAADLGAREPYPAFDRDDPVVNFLVGLSRDYLDPLGVEFGLRAIRQSLNYVRKAADMGIDQEAALNNVVLHKILPKMIIELDKTSPMGGKRRDLLVGLREALAEELADVAETMVTESALFGLDGLMAHAESNHGIANFWAR